MQSKDDDNIVWFLFTLAFGAVVTAFIVAAIGLLWWWVGVPIGS